MGIGSSIQYKSLGGKGWEWPLIFSFITVLFSVLLLVNPIFASISIVFMTAFSLLTLGIYRIVLALTLRKVHKSISHNEVALASQLFCFN